MTREVEEALARARDIFERIPMDPAAHAMRFRRVQRGVAGFFRRVVRATTVNAAIAVAAAIWAIFVSPIGISGLLLLGLAMLLIGMTILFWPGKRAPDAAQLTQLAPAALPAQTETFLDARRRALPALAAPRIDAISHRLSQLEPQLRRVGPADPVAQDLQRLLGTHLPELVDSYARIPAAARDRNMDKRLAESLDLVENELGRASEALASGDRDAFLTRGRYLETRYGKDEA
jgi:hypothetical protein